MLETRPFGGTCRLEDLGTESANAEGVASNAGLSGQPDRAAQKVFHLCERSRHLSHDSTESRGDRELRSYFSTLAGRLCLFGGIKEVWLRILGQVLACFFSYTFPISLLLVWSTNGTPSTCQKNILHFAFCPGWATWKRPEVTIFRLVFLSVCLLPDTR